MKQYINNSGHNPQTSKNKKASFFNPKANRGAETSRSRNNSKEVNKSLNDVNRYSTEILELKKSKIKKEIHYISYYINLLKLNNNYSQSILQNRPSLKIPLSSPVIDLKSPTLDFNCKTYFAYSPTYLMKDTKKRKENNEAVAKNPRVYYENYLENIQEIFNKNLDRTSCLIVKPKQTKKLENRSTPTKASKNLILSRLGTINYLLTPKKRNSLIKSDKTLSYNNELY